MDQATRYADAYPPREIARMVERLGVAKAQTDTITLSALSALAVLAGAFISFGALFYTFTITGSSLGFGLTRLLGGLSFCLGPVLVVVAGAELFTANNLLAGIVRNLVAVSLGNIVGGTLPVASIYWVAYLRPERRTEPPPS